MSLVADVYKGSEHAATLTRHDDRVEFSYLPTYAGEPVASTLRLGAGTVTAPAGQLPAFFVGLLPEGRRLSALVAALKASADDELTLLLAVGADTVGDVRVIRAGEELSEPDQYVQASSWEGLDFEALFEKSLGVAFDRVGIPGVQPKLSGRMISFPAIGIEGHVIVKLDPPEYRHLVRVEAAMTQSARSTGLFTVPTTSLVEDVRGRMGLVVERFDRATTETGLSRFPVEDGCQVLGRYPADKYLLDTVEVIAGLSERCISPAVARIQLLQRFLLSYLAGDGDLHARNMAIWKGPSGVWQPSPIFDLVCTAVYDDVTLAAPFDGRERIREMGRRRFVDTALHLGVPEKAVVHLLDTSVPVIASAVQSALESPVFADFPTRPKVQRLTARRASLLMD